MKIVWDGGRKRRTEHRNGRGVDEPRPVVVADGADRLEQRASAVKIDAIAFVEIEFGFAGDDTGEVKDDVGAAGDRFGGLGGRC